MKEIGSHLESITMIGTVFAKLPFFGVLDKVLKRTTEGRVPLHIIELYMDDFVKGVLSPK